MCYTWVLTRLTNILVYNNLVNGIGSGGEFSEGGEGGWKRGKGLGWVEINGHKFLVGLVYHLFGGIFHFVLYVCACVVYWWRV